MGLFLLFLLFNVYALFCFYLVCNDLSFNQVSGSFLGIELQ